MFDENDKPQMPSKRDSVIQMDVDADESENPSLVSV